jgi:uncharacterized protein DUF2863
MKRTRFPGRPKLSRDAERLARLANGLADSGSRVEDTYWESRLVDLIDRLLTAGNDAAIESALDQLWGPNPQSYDRLIDLVEARTEGGTLEYKGTTYDVLMIAAPVLVWSRYSIPAGPLAQGILDTVRVHLQAHLLASGAQLALAEPLFSPDQLPRGYGATLDFATRLWAAALEGRDLRLDPRDLPETQRFLSDTRYLLGAIAAPRGAPLFRWQEEDASREQAAQAWKTQGGPSLQAAMPGCAYEVVAPDAYYAAWRQADRFGRPYSLRSAVAFLQGALDVEPGALRAVVAPFHDRQLEEYRIGFTLRDKSEVVYGVVWALIGAEDETTDCVAEIRAVLRECGVTELVELENRFPLEYCDDCGAPLFPNPEAESMHAEMPDSSESVPSHLH